LARDICREEEPLLRPLADGRLARLLGGGADTLATRAGDPEAVASTYHLSREQVDAALAYYDRNRSLIDNRLAQNHAA